MERGAVSVRHEKRRGWNVSFCVVRAFDFRALTRGVMDMMVLLLAGRLMSCINREYALR